MTTETARAPLNNRELAIVALSMLAVIAGGLWGLAVLWGGVERMDPWARAERECAGLAPDGVDSPERTACVNRIVNRDPYSLTAMIGPGLLGMAGAVGVIAVAVARRRTRAEPSSG